MKIGQPFYRLNNKFVLSAFEEHQFDVVFIIGIEKTATNQVVIECNSVKSTIADVNSKNKFVLNPTDLTMDVNVDEFMRMSDTGQNDSFRDNLGYFSNPEDLRLEHKSLALGSLAKERQHLQEETDRLNYIENELDSGGNPFVASKVENGAVEKGDTFEFMAMYGSTDVTRDTLFFVEDNPLGPGNNSYTPSSAGTFEVKAVYGTYESNFNFNVL